jgi:pectate lyase
MPLFRIAILLIFAGLSTAATAQAFPGAAGWAAQTAGGRGGTIIRVTNLNAAGPGSFRAAVEARGPRIVVFEVGGVIDLGLTTLDITEPFLTIAGQTAPSPGITIIRGGLDVHGHDVIIRHIRIRTGVSGQARRSGWEADALSTVGAWNVIVDHCTMTWALDENLSASGPRFEGRTPADWRRGTSHDVTFSYNLLAEGIAEGSHPKGEHSKGSLIHDNVTDILIYRNIYAHNMERSPLLKGGVHAAVVNNLIFDPGSQAVHYNLMDLEWADHPHQDGQLSAVGNVLRAGFSTRSDIAFLTIGGAGDLRYFGRDNIAVDRQGRPLPMFGRYTTGPARIIPVARADVWPAGLAVLPANQVETEVLRNAGARPWDRDPHDLRIIFDVAEGRGHIIDDEREVGGYPHPQETHAPFVEAAWNLDTMEPRSGHYPGEQAGRIQQPTSVRDANMRRERN